MSACEMVHHKRGERGIALTGRVHSPASPELHPLVLTKVNARQT